ncbi:hypothetical protein MsAg5_17440 [Methanosarcinaceae archaeon Ag5]|uniref:DUF169 domain-containing protein n=1 Tax=Methanolapillus africanus TaxID=3028297 RepID=A0AAE4MLL5_9EURY|nr:hypothetical protein [Methanosarcinaceae archaeon Ag5]
MEIITFIQNYKEAFGESAELPVAFWYSNTPVAQTEKITGCFFKEMRNVRDGKPAGLNAENISCPGGKFYTGFTEMPPFVPNFVSGKEKYKETPELVIDFLNQLDVQRARKKYLNLARVDQVERFDDVEGIIFFATPDMLSGLASWAYFDNNSDGAVTSKFGAGCSSVIAEAVAENNRNGRRTFIGLFDPSVRPHIEKNVLSFTIPMSRFKEMYGTMRNCCLIGTADWDKMRDRINKV